MFNVIEAQNALKNLSKEQLVQEMKSPSGMAPQYLVLTELQRRKQMQDEFNARQGSQQQPTVAEQVVAGAGIPMAAGSQMAQSLAPQTDMAMNTAQAPVQMMQDGGQARSIYGGLTGPGTIPLRGRGPSERDILEFLQAQNAAPEDIIDVSDEAPTMAMPQPQTGPMQPRVGAGYLSTPPRTDVPDMPGPAPVDPYLERAQGVRAGAGELATSLLAGGAPDGRVDFPVDVSGPVNMTSQAVGDATALFNRAVTNPAIQAVGYGTSLVSPEAGAKVFEFGDRFARGTDRLAEEGAFGMREGMPPEQGPPAPQRVPQAPGAPIGLDMGQIVEGSPELSDAMTMSLATSEGGLSFSKAVEKEIEQGTEKVNDLATQGGGSGGGGGGSVSASASSSAIPGYQGAEQMLMERLNMLEEQREEAKWMALANFGLGLMASESPLLGRAAGEAGQQAMAGYQENLNQLQDDEDAILDAQLQLAIARDDQAAAMRLASMKAARGGGRGGGGGGIAGLPKYDTERDRLFGEIRAYEGEADDLYGKAMEALIPDPVSGEVSDQAKATAEFYKARAQEREMQAMELRNIYGAPQPRAYQSSPAPAAGPSPALNMGYPE